MPDTATITDTADDVIEPAWDTVNDDLNTEMLNSESGYDAQWSTYGGSSTSPGKCC